MKEKHTYHHTDASGILPKVTRVNPYTVPHGYFENLYLLTTQKCHFIDSTPGIPDDYFEQLTDSITARIAEQTLKNTVGESGFAVPEGYFSEAALQVIATCKIKEQVTGTGFAVPEFYFNTLPDRIGQQTYAPATPVRKLSRPKWVAYAAAASIALVLGFVGLFRTAIDAPDTKNPLASVSDEQIVDYLELYGLPNDMIYISSQLDNINEPSIGEGISEEDIEAYLDHTL